MTELVSNIKQFFSSKEDYFKTFSKVDTRVEGWFKGELLLLFENLVNEGRIQAFQRELNIQGTQGRKSIDFEVKFKNDKSALIELKALTISRSAGTPRNLNFYFRDDHVGLFKDFSKLDSLEYVGDKYLVGFIYPKPATEAWHLANEKIVGQHKGWTCVSDINDYPETHFISVWTRNASR